MMKSGNSRFFWPLHYIPRLNSSQVRALVSSSASLTSLPSPALLPFPPSFPILFPWLTREWRLHWVPPFPSPWMSLSMELASYFNESRPSRDHVVLQHCVKYLSWWQSAIEFLILTLDMDIRVVSRGEEITEVNSLNFAIANDRGPLNLALGQPFCDPWSCQWSCHLETSAQGVGDPLSSRLSSCYLAQT